MKSIMVVPVQDYFKSRKRLFIKFLLPFLVGLISLLITLFFNIGNTEKVTAVFSEFIDAQINIVAILISFSVAIITILVSADNENIRQLKDSESDTSKYKPVNGKQLSLFQILLSNIAYNVIVEVLYLIGLIGFVLLKSIIPLEIFKYITAMCIFFILHIFFVLLESVAQMYLTFWDRKL